MFSFSMYECCILVFFYDHNVFNLLPKKEEGNSIVFFSFFYKCTSELDRWADFEDFF